MRHLARSHSFKLQLLKSQPVLKQAPIVSAAWLLLLCVLGTFGTFGTFGTASAANDGGGAAIAVPSKTVFLVCEGDFRIENEDPDGLEVELFEGSLYLSITHSDDVFTAIQLQPFERDERLPAQNFVPSALTPPASFQETPVTPPFSEKSYVRIDATQDQVILHHTRSTGSIVRARIDDQPLVPTQMHVETADMTLNRFSGGMQMVWTDQHVRDVKPRGAIRATKVAFFDRKSFDATCHTMKERLF